MPRLPATEGPRTISSMSLRRLLLPLVSSWVVAVSHCLAASTEPPADANLSRELRPPRISQAIGRWLSLL